MWSIELRAQLAAAVELSWTTNWQPQAGSERRLNMCRHVEPVRKSPRYLPSCWGRPQARPQLWGSARDRAYHQSWAWPPDVAQSRPGPIPGSGLGWD